MLDRVFASPHMRPADRLVLLALADRCNSAGLCWSSLADIARRAGLDQRRVRRIVRHLEACGALVVERRRGRSSIYRPMPEELGAATQDTRTPGAETRGDGARHPGRGRPPNPQEPRDSTEG
jgi:hypothetical protein